MISLCHQSTCLFMASPFRVPGQTHGHDCEKAEQKEPFWGHAVMSSSLDVAASSVHQAQHVLSPVTGWLTGCCVYNTAPSASLADLVWCACLFDLHAHLHQPTALACCKSNPPSPHVALQMPTAVLSWPYLTSPICNIAISVTSVRCVHASCGKSCPWQNIKTLFIQNNGTVCIRK